MLCKLSRRQKRSGKAQKGNAQLQKPALQVCEPVQTLRVCVQHTRQYQVIVYGFTGSIRRGLLQEGSTTCMLQLA